MKKYFHCYLALVFIVGTACFRSNSRIEYALRFAEANRGELERVLEYYEKDINCLKLKAAEFLISNMPYKYSYQSWQIDTIKSLKAATGLYGKLTDEDKKNWRHLNFATLPKVYDAKVITTNYLIDNIEFSFNIWETSPWGKYYSFDDFCEYILPYRIGDEPLENWKPVYYQKYRPILDSIYPNANVVEAGRCIANYLKSEKFSNQNDINLPHLGALFLYEHRLGYCRENCDIAVYTMRSLGIPVAIDKYLMSPCYQSKHFWNALIDTNHVPIPFNYMEKEISHRSQLGRKSGKIYRLMYGVQPEKAEGIYSSQNVPVQMKDVFAKDVTSTYFNNNIDVSVESQIPNDYVYLSVFNSGDWYPVDIAKVNGNKATFKGVENDLIYTVVAIYGGQKYPVGYPFVLRNNHPEYFHPNKEDTICVLLTRKYPMMEGLKKHLKSICGVQIRGNNIRELKDASTLLTVTDTLNTNMINFTLVDPIKFRYIFYSAPEKKRIQLAEMHFFSDKKDENELSPFISGLKPLSELHQSITKLINDKNMVSFYMSQVDGETLVFDFGRPVSIKQMDISPRNDDNFIHNEDVYELFYHNGIEGWISLGRQTGKRVALQYDHVPKNALLWLHNHSGGREEEVFFYENGKQIFALDI